MLRDDGACLHADNVQALASATAEDQAAYVRQLERDLEDGGVCGASAAGAEAEQEGVPAAIRRRYFASHSDGAAVDGPHAFEIVLAGTEADSSCRDHLTWYYCDFLEAAPAGPAPLPPQPAAGEGQQPQPQSPGQRRNSNPFLDFF